MKQTVQAHHVGNDKKLKLTSDDGRHYNEQIQLSKSNDEAPNLVRSFASAFPVRLSNPNQAHNYKWTCEIPAASN